MLFLAKVLVKSLINRVRRIPEPNPPVVILFVASILLHRPILDFAAMIGNWVYPELTLVWFVSFFIAIWLIPDQEIRKTNRSLLATVMLRGVLPFAFVGFVILYFGSPYLPK